MEKLLSYQIPHTLQLQEALQFSNCVLDASDTGTGKTYCALTVCKLEKLTPLIICPKSVISSWIEVSKFIGIDILGIANYEMIKQCKYYTKNLEAVSCPFIDKHKEDFIFQFPSDVVLIFDEAHRCKNHKTITSKLLLSASYSNNKIILLSATISDKIKCFKQFGVVFGFYSDRKDYKKWIKNKGCFRGEASKTSVKITSPKAKLSFIGNSELEIIHHEIFPKHGSRMKISELGDLFPKNQILAKCYHSDDYDKINELYEEINQALLGLKDKETQAESLGRLVVARQKIEMFKVPIIVDLAQEAIDNGYSVVIFVNFHQTLDHICRIMKCDSVIHGKQTLDERQTTINNFQSNKINLLVSIIQAGGVGISLHDIHGNHPRMSIISPTWSGQDFVQVLGRIHRAGSKTPALQRIVYCAKTCEEQMYDTIKNKLNNIQTINDGDVLFKKDIPIEYIDLMNKKENKQIEDDEIEIVKVRKFDF